MLRRDSLPAFAQDYLTEDMLLFDIETTGLSPARDTVYCIGCGYAKGDEVIVELFFAEGPSDEPEVLASFFALTQTHPYLITFNGTTFDLPFLKKRTAILSGVSADEAEDSAVEAEGTADKCTGGAGEGAGSGPIPGGSSHLDLYREAKAMRGLLDLPSYKQKSIEQFLGIGREDLYTGGELIEFYQRYVEHPDPEILKPVLLHNREDVIGMFGLLGILAYRQFSEGEFEIGDMIEETEEYGTDRPDGSDKSTGGTDRYDGTAERPDGSDEPAGTRSYLNVKLHPKMPLPQSIHHTASAAGARPYRSGGNTGTDGETDCVSFLIDRNAALIRFPIYHGELKHFFDDPENYYYLPEEDTAVHRSVGQFVDPSHRVRATRKNCYIKKECDYLALPHRSGKADPSGSCPGKLKKDYGDRELCLELPAREEDIKAFVSQYFTDL